MAGKLDTSQEAQDEVQEEQEEQEVQEKPKPFNEEQEQYLGSWLGRIVAKQLDEKVVPMFNERLSQPQQINPMQNDYMQNDVVTKFNEDISTQIFTDPYGAFTKMMNVYQGTQKNLSQAQKSQTDKVLMSYSESPYYKEIFTDMQKVAHEAVGQGYPPEAAAEYAFQKARADHLDKKVGGGDNLDMLDGGISRKRTKKAVLPPQFKDAYIRDKEKGLFKTEEEYIAALAPQIRAQYGI